MSALLYKELAMIRRILLTLLLILPLSYSLWIDLVRFVLSEIFSEAGTSDPAPQVPGDDDPDGGPGMDPWG